MFQAHSSNPKVTEKIKAYDPYVAIILSSGLPSLTEEGYYAVQTHYIDLSGDRASDLVSHC